MEPNKNKNDESQTKNIYVMYVYHVLSSITTFA